MAYAKDQVAEVPNKFSGAYTLLSEHRIADLSNRIWKNVINAWFPDNEGILSLPFYHTAEYKYTLHAHSLLNLTYLI